MIPKTTVHFTIIYNDFEYDQSINKSFKIDVEMKCTLFIHFEII